MKLNLKDIVLFSFLGAILSVSQIAMSFLPNIEIVSLLIILFTLVYDKKSLYSIGIFLLVEGLFYGFGTWWIGYIIIWPTLVLLTLILKRWINGNYLSLSIFSGIFGFIFGMLYAIPYLFIADWSFALAYWLRGLPYDLIHMVGNYFTMLALGKIIYDLLLKLNRYYFVVKRT